MSASAKKMIKEETSVWKQSQRLSDGSKVYSVEIRQYTGDQLQPLAVVSLACSDRKNQAEVYSSVFAALKKSLEFVTEY